MDDLRFALRMLKKNLVFTVIAVATLAAGIGANTAVFSMVHALLLHPVAFERLDRLMVVAGDVPGVGAGDDPIAPADFLDFDARGRSFAILAAQSQWDANLTGGDLPERVRVAGITHDVFQALGVRPALGRGFLARENQPGLDGFAILSHGLWTRRYGARTDVVGQTLRIDGRPRVVAGVMGADFEFPRGIDLWVPLAWSPEQRARRDLRNLSVVGRLRDGVSRDAAQAELSAIAADLARSHPASHAGRGVRVRPLREVVAGDVAPTFYALLTLAAALVLMIACVNVANLLLARASARGREIAVRTALGASRGRLLRQLLVESLLLALLGALAGVVVAMWGVELMIRSIPTSVARFIPGWQGFAVDGPTLAFAVAAAVVASVVFGLAPALQTLRVDVHEALKQGARTAGGGGLSLRRALVIVELATALVLVSGAGLVVQGFQRMQQQSPGFDPRGVLALRATLMNSRYDTPEKVAAFQTAAIERLEAIPGVAAAGATSRLPWSDWGGRGTAWPLEVDGKAQRPEERTRTALRLVSAGYLKTMGTPLVAGRDLQASDVADGEPVAVVGAALARRIAPGGDVLGRRVRIEHPVFGETWRRVVGVCGDVTHAWWESKPAALCYLPAAQAAANNMIFTVRAQGDPRALVPEVRAAFREIDADQPVYAIEPLEQSIADLFSPLRLSSAMMTAFAVLALLLSLLGVYGLIAYSVSRRTQEIGVRLALGASRASVLRMVVGQGLRLASIGLLLGLPIAFAMGMLAQSQMFGVVALDVPLLAVLSLSLLLAASIASWLPARHAARLDPMTALRNE